jgi:hypothetical protein
MGVAGGKLLDDRADSSLCMLFICLNIYLNIYLWMLFLNLFSTCP